MKNVMLAEPGTIVLFGGFVFFLAFLLALIGAAVFLIVHFTRKSKKTAPPSASPVAPGTQIIPRKCPQCDAELKPDVSEGLCPACLLQRGIATEGGAPPGTPPFVPPTIPDLARLFPQLEILELIGKGGMGAVYKARQPALDRFVALKILAPRSPAGDLDFAGRFTREARALAKLSHPNIVAVYDFGRAELPLGQDAQQRVPTTPVHYFIMEFVDGPNLRQVEQAGKLSPREALEIIPQICAALQFAHDEGIVHRDIKPENILLDKKGRVKIADFGLAKILGQEPKDFRLTGARDIMGTPHYMAPEQVEKPQTVDHRADIYSLGVVFYEMLTGELPLGKFQPPSQKVQVDVRLDEVVMRSLEKEPQRRYQHVSEIKTQVERIATTTAPGSSRREEAPSESQSRLAPAATTSPLRHGVRAGLGVFLGVVILATGITFLMPESYVGIARVELAGASPQNYDPYRLQTEFAVIESSVVLKPVADSLNLGKRWRKMFAEHGRTLPDDEVVELLKHELALQPVRNTSIFEVQYYSQSSKEAAEIANKISEVYCALPPGHRGEIIDPAIVPLRPARPNRPLNIFIGVLVGLALGVFTGIAVGLFSLWRRRQASPPTVQKPDRFWRWFAVGVLALISIPIVIAIIGLLAAIAIPNFVKARQHSQQAAVKQWTQEGWQLWQAQKMAGAAAKFQQAIQLAPDDADAWNGLGWATFNSGKSQEAEQAFQKAISLDTNQPGALNGLGQVYLSQRKYDQAETYLLKAAPQAPAAWYGLARLYLLEGKFDQAESWAQKMVDSGQADETAKKMLEAARQKKLSDGLRLMIEPPTSNPAPAKTLADTNDLTEAATKAWHARVERLRQRLEQNPQAGIPELKFLTEYDWLEAAKDDLKTDADYRRALNHLRVAGETHFVDSQLQPALKIYVEVNHGQFPANLAQLQPFFQPPVDEAILQRYEIVPHEKVPDAHWGGDWVVTQKSPVDKEYDRRLVVGAEGGWGRIPF
jgi:serine/threonine protein kinase/Tfp pilus assembly protein PilF